MPFFWMDASVDEFAIAAARDADAASAVAAWDAFAFVADELSAFAAACAAVLADALATVVDVDEALRDASAVLATCAAMLASGLAAAEA